MNGEADMSGIILSGGSVYAAYEIGVMKALFTGDSPASEGLPVDAQVFTGTSAGSLNAAWMVSQRGATLADSAEALGRLWMDELAETSASCGTGAIRYRGNPLEFLNPVCFARNPITPLVHATQDFSFFLQDWTMRAINLVDTQGPVLRRLLELIDLSSIVSVNPLRRILQQAIPLPNIRESELQLRVGATNWQSGTLKVFSNEDMTDELGVDVIMASTAFPGLPPVYIRDEAYVDGGYVMNEPLLPAIDAGANTLHFIYMDPDPAQIPIRRLQNTIDVIDKMFVLMRASVFNRDIKVTQDINAGLDIVEGRHQPESQEAEIKSFIRTVSQIRARIESSRPYRKIAIHRYHPSDDLGGVLGLLNFDRDHIEYLINRGYQDAVTHDCVASGCVIPTGM